jgi:hypothetical protein
MKVTFLYKEKQQNEGWMKSLFGFGWTVLEISSNIKRLESDLIIWLLRSCPAQVHELNLVLL